MREVFLSGWEHGLANGESLTGFSVVEVERVVWDGKRGSAPGPDGLPLELYQYFWEEFKDPLVALFNEVLRSGVCPASWARCNISLLPKKGDPFCLNTWRLITLLNGDYKILAKVLLGKLQVALGDRLGVFQRCGVKGRRATDVLIVLRGSIPPISKPIGGIFKIVLYISIINHCKG